MKKRISIILAVALLLCLIPVGTVRASAAGEFEVSQECVEQIKRFEGFSEKPYWDYSQYTVGYGTRPLTEEDRARYEAEGISREEAHTLLMQALEKAAKSLNSFIVKYDLKLTQGQFDALLSLTFNCGSAWLYRESNFRSAVIEGRIGNDFLFAIGQWCTAGGSVHNGLIRRRLVEANMYLNDLYENTVPENYCYVLYNANGGTADVRVQAYDSNITASIIATASREGCIFEGWYSEPNGGTRVNLLNADTRNDTLYAHWSADPNYVPPETEPTQPEDSTNVNTTVTVTANQVNIRKGPGTDHPVVTRLNSGEKLTITEIAEGSGYTWGKFEGGWIALNYTDYQTSSEEEQKPEPQMGTVTGDGLRIRTGPSTGYGIVDHLYKGNRVEILEVQTAGSSQWGRINKGWISMSYVKLDETAAEKPDATEPTAPPATEPTVPPTTEPTVPPATEPTVPPTTEPTVPEATTPGKETEGTGMGTVTGDALRIRKGAGTNYGVAGHLYTGDRVEILEQKTVGSMTWGRISKGWISMNYVEMDASVGTQSSVTGTVQVNGLLRIRTAAGTTNPIAGYLENGDSVEILSQKTVNGTVWGKITKGWICLDYVKLDGSQTKPEETPSQARRGTVTASTLYVRSDAGTGNKIVAYLFTGAKVEVLESKTVGSTVWGRINKGWISLDYVKF